MQELEDVKSELSGLRERVKLLEDSPASPRSPDPVSSSLVPSQQVSSSQEFKPNSLLQALQVSLQARKTN